MLPDGQEQDTLLSGLGWHILIYMELFCVTAAEMWMLMDYTRI